MLTKRLNCILNYVNCKVAADVGTDHAYIAVELIKSGKAEKVIASDINEGPLNIAKSNIIKEGLSEKIETRLGNGLDTLKESDGINAVVISGMGAHTVVGILKNNLDKLKNIDTIIIQSNTKLEFLRKEVTKLNYLIDDELLIEDNKKIYTIIKFIKGKRKYNKKELYFGPILLKKNTKLFQNNNQKELDKLNLLLKMLPQKKIIDRYKIKKKIKMYN